MEAWPLGQMQRRQCRSPRRTLKPNGLRHNRRQAIRLDGRRQVWMCKSASGPSRATQLVPNKATPMQTQGAAAAASDKKARS